MANNEEGREVGANEKLIDHLVNECYATSEQEYLDFGISTENEGQFLNDGLISYKESYGANAFVHDFYRIDI